MNIMIVEDEARIARRIERFTRAFFGSRLGYLVHYDSLAPALQQLERNPPDALLLDLNLNGQDGFTLLESVVACSFHTIIISAHVDKAITAFAYGVLDFVPKPFGEERLGQAFTRLIGADRPPDTALEVLAVRKQGQVVLIDVKELRYIKGAGIYAELHLLNGRAELHDKSLEKLSQLLPAVFMRIHKSYLVPLDGAEKILVGTGGRYQLQLRTGELLPIGRSRYRELRNRLL